MILPATIALDFAAYALREGHETIPFLALCALFGAVTFYIYCTEERRT
jgi:hypothetical protein